MSSQRNKEANWCNVKNFSNTLRKLHVTYLEIVRYREAVTCNVLNLRGYITGSMSKLVNPSRSSLLNGCVTRGSFKTSSTGVIDYKNEKSNIHMTIRKARIYLGDDP